MEAIDKLKALLSLPDAPTADDLGSFPSSGELPCYFDPWELFPQLYGTYSAEFDRMAVRVLENIHSGQWRGEGLAEEMFREMLCTADLCDYGVSPRGCFPNWEVGFNALLPELITRWKRYRNLRWGLSDKDW